MEPDDIKKNTKTDVGFERPAEAGLEIKRKRKMEIPDIDMQNASIRVDLDKILNSLNQGLLFLSLMETVGNYPGKLAITIDWINIKKISEWGGIDLKEGVRGYELESSELNKILTEISERLAEDFSDMLLTSLELSTAESAIDDAETVLRYLSDKLIPNEKEKFFHLRQVLERDIEVNVLFFTRELENLSL